MPSLPGCSPGFPPFLCCCLITSSLASFGDAVLWVSPREKGRVLCHPWSWTLQGMVNPDGGPSEGGAVVWGEMKPSLAHKDVGPAGVSSFRASSHPLYWVVIGTAESPGAPHPSALGLSWQIPGTRPTGEGLSHFSQTHRHFAQLRSKGRNDDRCHRPGSLSLGSSCPLSAA